MPFSRGSSRPRDETWVSWITGRFFTIWATRVAYMPPKLPTPDTLHLEYWSLTGVLTNQAQRNPYSQESKDKLHLSILVIDLTTFSSTPALPLRCTAVEEELSTAIIYSSILTSVCRSLLSVVVSLFLCRSGSWQVDHPRPQCIWTWTLHSSDIWAQSFFHQVLSDPRQNSQWRMWLQRNPLPSSDSTRDTNRAQSIPALEASARNKARKLPRKHMSTQKHTHECSQQHHS